MLNRKVNFGLNYVSLLNSIQKEILRPYYLQLSLAPHAQFSRGFRIHRNWIPISRCWIWEHKESVKIWTKAERKSWKQTKGQSAKNPEKLADKIQCNWSCNLENTLVKEV